MLKAAPLCAMCFFVFLAVYIFGDGVKSLLSSNKLHYCTFFTPRAITTTPFSGKDTHIARLQALSFLS